MNSYSPHKRKPGSAGLMADKAFRAQVWKRLTKTRPKPKWINAAMLEKARPVLDRNGDFWNEMLEKYGLRYCELELLDPGARERLTEAFWRRVGDVLGKMRGMGRPARL